MARMGGTSVPPIPRLKEVMGMARHLRDDSGYGKNTGKAPFKGKQTTPMDSKSPKRPGSRILNILLRKGRSK